MKSLVIALALFAAPAFADVVEFHIPAGTDRNDWNTLEQSVVVHPGDTLQIHNDDEITHQLHTFGRPCPHGGAIAPGAFSDYCKIYADSALGDYTLYDHRTFAKFFVKVVAPE